MGVIAAQLKQSEWKLEPAFGYETKYKREQFLKLPKSPLKVAVVICCEDGKDGETVKVGNTNV